MSLTLSEELGAIITDILLDTGRTSDGNWKFVGCASYGSNSVECSGCHKRIQRAVCTKKGVVIAFMTVESDETLWAHVLHKSCSSKFRDYIKWLTRNEEGTTRIEEREICIK